MINNTQLMKLINYLINQNKELKKELSEQNLKYEPLFKENQILKMQNNSFTQKYEAIKDKYYPLCDKYNQLKQLCKGKKK